MEQFTFNHNYELLKNIIWERIFLYRSPKWYINSVIAKKRWWDKMSELSNWIDNILNDSNWTNQSITVSAIRSDWNKQRWLKETNTTNQLIEIANLLNVDKPDKNLINEKIETLRLFHLVVISDQFWSNEIEFKAWTSIINREFNLFKKAISKSLKNWDKTLLDDKWDYSISIWDNKYLSILWEWELIAQRIFTKMINVRAKINWVISWNNVLAVAVDVENLISTKTLKKRAFKVLVDVLEKELCSIFKQWKIPVISWYTWRFRGWILNVFGKWYSDATAAASAVAQWRIFKNKKSILQIQKSLPSLMSWDPKIVWKIKARPISELSYNLWRYITWINAWAWAKVLNPFALSEALQDAWIEVHIMNPDSKAKDGSWIKPKIEINDYKKVSFVWWQKDIHLITVDSATLSQRPGFALQIFGIAEECWANIGHIETTETWVNFTLPSNDALSDKLKEKLERKFWGNAGIYLQKNLSLIWIFSENVIHVLDTEEDEDKVRLLRNKISETANWILDYYKIPTILSSRWWLNWSKIFIIKKKHFENAIQFLHENLVK